MARLQLRLIQSDDSPKETELPESITHQVREWISGSAGRNGRTGTDYRRRTCVSL